MHCLKSIALASSVALGATLFLAGCRANPSIVTGGGTPAGANGGPGPGSSGGGTSGAAGAPNPGFTFQVPDGGPGRDGPAIKSCENLCKRQMQCPAGADTTVSGTVLAPTPPAFGKPDPIYNATVYVPNAVVEPFKVGVACDTCGTPASGSPLVIALTGSDGKFVLKNAPTGDNVPLVIQVGRWRRQVTIPRVAPCTDNPLPAELTRLPRNKGEGDIPQMAISTGRVDALECVLRKVGIDRSEFTLPAENGRVHFYVANGASLGPNTPPAGQLTSSPDTLKRYDVLIFECEGNPILKGAADKQNVIDYTNAGGRLFLTHYSYTWLFDMPPFQGTAAWNADAVHPTFNDTALTGTIDQSFPKGKDFATWLQLVGATAPMPGQIQINVPRHDLDSVVPPSQRWIYTAMPDTVQHFTFNTPVGVAEEKQCGRVLFSDFHVNSIAPTVPIIIFPQPAPPVFPAECKDEPLTPQEKVMEFMLFDLSSCVQPDSRVPVIQ